MTVSKEVSAAVDKIRQDGDIISSMRAADKVRDKQLADLQAQIDAAKGLSDDDRSALNTALADTRDVHDDLADAVSANTAPQDANAPAPVQTGSPSTSADAGPIDGPSAADGGAQVPLMPTSAFDPAGGVKPPAAVSGQPNQPAAIETPGGFVIAGGGATARAVGSMPDSPSSSVVVPLDPDAKAPNSNADLVKSGLGDSSQNALLGADGRPIADGPGIPKEPSQADQDAAQKQADLLAQEKAARDANPLNVAPAGTPQAGSPEADNAAADARAQEQRDAQAKQQAAAANDAGQGKPAPGTPGPDPVSAPATFTVYDSDPANAEILKRQQAAAAADTKGEPGDPNVPPPNPAP